MKDTIDKHEKKAQEYENERKKDKSQVENLTLTIDKQRDKIDELNLKLVEHGTLITQKDTELKDIKKQIASLEKKKESYRKERDDLTRKEKQWEALEEDLNSEIKGEKEKGEKKWGRSVEKVLIKLRVDKSKPVYMTCTVCPS